MRQGFQMSIAHKIYSHISSGLEKMEEILHAMQEAGNQCGEVRIGKHATNEIASDSENRLKLSWET